MRNPKSDNGGPRNVIAHRVRRARLALDVTQEQQQLNAMMQNLGLVCLGVTGVMMGVMIGLVGYAQNASCMDSQNNVKIQPPRAQLPQQMKENLGSKSSLCLSHGAKTKGEPVA